MTLLFLLAPGLPAYTAAGHQNRICLHDYRDDAWRRPGVLLSWKRTYRSIIKKYKATFSPTRVPVWEGTT